MVRTICGMMQTPIQAFLRPAMWLPGIKKLHSHEEKWVLQNPDITVDAFFDAILDVMKKFKHENPRGEIYDVRTVNRDRGFMEIHAFPFCEWLDVMEIVFDRGTVLVRSFSTGFLPVLIPFSVLFNLFLFFIPFYDRKYNKLRIECLREYLEYDVDVEKVGGCC